MLRRYWRHLSSFSRSDSANRASSRILGNPREYGFRPETTRLPVASVEKGGGGAEGNYPCITPPRSPWKRFTRNYLRKFARKFRSVDLPAAGEQKRVLDLGGEYPA
ncbi:unnamed protein product [Lasius platythorax]|uniref:Uncharacterized protein n=1 Tax=Lasius platythorax TaxID=488582 RepID=A0AAV2NUC0_9HYME